MLEQGFTAQVCVEAEARGFSVVAKVALRYHSFDSWLVRNKLPGSWKGVLKTSLPPKLSQAYGCFEDKFSSNVFGYCYSEVSFYTSYYSDVNLKCTFGLLWY